MSAPVTLIGDNKAISGVNGNVYLFPGTSLTLSRAVSVRSGSLTVLNAGDPSNAPAVIGALSSLSVQNAAQLVFGNATHPVNLVSVNVTSGLYFRSFSLLF